MYQRFEMDYSIEYVFNYSSLQQLEETIKNCKDLNRRFDDKSGKCYIHIAAEREDNTMVQMLLDHRAAIDIVDNFESSPLHGAARAGYHETVQLLVDRGADVSSLDNIGNSALHKTPSKKVAEILIRNGASTHDKNVRNQSALHIVYIYSRYGNLKEITEFWIEQGAEIDGLDSYDRSPLFYAAQNFKTEAALVLINNGADVNRQDYKGWTPLHGTIGNTDRHRYPPVVELLLNHGASLDVPDESGDTPFHLALRCRWENVTLMKLLQSGVKLDVMNREGYTALHMAVHNGKYEPIAQLLMYGFSISAEDEDGDTPYDHADVECQQFMVRYIHLSNMAGLPVCQDVDIPLSEEETKKAAQELDKIKTTDISKQVCLYEILAQFRRPGYLLIDGVIEDMETFFKASDFHDRFPMYAEILKCTFNRSKNSRHYLIRRATLSMINDTRKEWCRLIPDLVWEQVCKFLSLQDLNNIIHSGH